ncbi:MAG: lipolytic protein family [Firmicutes bacterium]|nr:lipolytic protein family [Bacillota bacterium]
MEMRMKSKITILIICMFFTGAVTASANHAVVPTLLSGTAFSLSPMGKASVTVFDALGNRKSVIADKYGVYTVDVTEMKAPFLIHALESAGANFSDESKFRGKSITAILGGVTPHVKNTANVNPLSDRVVSEVALTLGYKGPIGLVLAGKTEGIKTEIIMEKTDKTRLMVLQALKDAGVATAEIWDPVTSIESSNVVDVLRLIRHNHGYDTATGQVGDTMLFDINFRPLSAIDILNFERASKEKAKLADKGIVHIYLAADSTCSNYETERTPRAGWGQIFQSKFKENAKVMIVNAAQSGRSSRTFSNEGWLRMIGESILPGDYLFIQFGHNDEKGGSAIPAKRDKFDIANTATYPNDAIGKIQGSEDLSFQRWLEKYIKLARDRQAIPVLLTPTTRIIVDQDKNTGLFPIQQSVHRNNSTNSSAKYFGDFSQTIRDTATANKVALIDIDAKTMTMANNIGEPQWKKLWLAVDPVQYPFYKKGMTGNIDLPDTTHFQINGASKVGDLIIEGLKKTPSLERLAKMAK